MKSVRHIVLASALLLLLPLGAEAQNHIRRAMDKARERREEMARRQVQADGVEGGRGYLRMRVENGDTTYLDALPPVYVFERGKARSQKQWRAYYKLVWRFARVYPYAQASGQLIKQVDSTLNAEHYRGLKKERYIDAVQKQLFRDFEKPMRNMSIQQGALLLKLINRETGLTPYIIIKDYKNRVAAGFWEAVAKLFDNSLKAGYDPTGADANIEELVQIWNAGEFPALYRSIFWEEPPQVTVPEPYL